LRVLKFTFAACLGWPEIQLRSKVGGVTRRPVHEPVRHGCAATRLSPAAVYDRLLLLDAAAPRTHASPAANLVSLRPLKTHAGQMRTVFRRSVAHPVRKTRSAWHSAQRHQGGSGGDRPPWGTATELSATSAWSREGSSTLQQPSAQTTRTRTRSTQPARVTRNTQHGIATD